MAWYCAKSSTSAKAAVILSRVEDFPYQLVSAIFGLCTGSFLTVCAHRIPDSIIHSDDEADVAPPRERLSIVHPSRSFCPHCKKQLTALQLVPVFSWLALRGRCGHCGAAIPWRYPLIELATGFLALSCCSHFGPTLTALGVFLFGCALIVISVIDYDHHIIPNVITYPGVVIGYAVSIANQYWTFVEPPFVRSAFISLIGSLAGSLFLLLIAELYFKLRKIEGLGLGDVKLLAMTGAFFGPMCALYTIFIGSFVGAIIGIFLMGMNKRSLTTEIPFGPYLALGTLIFLFWGREIMIFHLGAAVGMG